MWMSLEHTNHAGNVHGGQILKIVDESAALAAMRHTHLRVVTASLDGMTFERPVHIGDLLEVEARVNQAWNSSMEVGVRVWAENAVTGERQRVARAYLTMVCLDEHGKPSQVPKLVLDTEQDRRRAAEAEERRRDRLSHRS
jgi:acyl-CoA hydrolase